MCRVYTKRRAARAQCRVPLEMNRAADDDNNTLRYYYYIIFRLTGECARACNGCEIIKRV